MNIRKLLTVFVAAAFLLGSIGFAAPAVAEDSINGVVKLIAAQNIEVGEVITTNDADNIYVTYKLYSEKVTEGWLITETHLAIAANKDGIPQTKKDKQGNSNPIPGQFAYKNAHNPGVIEYTYEVSLEDLGTEGEDYVLAAHAVVEKTTCEVIVEAPYYASSWHSYKQGLRYDNTPVRPQRSNPNAALVYETGNNEANFFSLGFQTSDGDNLFPGDDAWIIVEFEHPIMNGLGNDLRIIEDTWGLPYPNERAEVYVSEDGLNFHLVGIAGNQNPISQYHTISDFDIDGIVEYAKYVKVRDISLRSDFSSRYPSQSATLDGFDLNAVASLQNHEICEILNSETAWGEGERFNKKGNWGMWFEYKLQEPSLGYWEKIDEIKVYPNGQMHESSVSLNDGVEYKLKASGVFYYNHALDWADAEWYLKNGQIVKGDIEGSVPYVLDLGIDNATINRDWGAYNPSHEYETYYSGAGDKVNFQIYDSNYSDNSSYLTVEIFAWQ